MVTSYYMSKLNKNTDFHSYYSDVYNTVTNNILSEKNICRICLKKAYHQIFKTENTIMADALISFAELEIDMGDDLPKELCDMCFKFIEATILFRKIAKRSDNILRQIKVNKNDNRLDFSPDNIEYDVRNDSEEHKEVVACEDPCRMDKKGDVKKTNTKSNPKITCEVCNKVINKSYYKEHLTMHQPNHKKYICDVCGKSFRLRCAYYNHSLRHGDDFPFKCKVCPYRGRYSELLKMHMRTHTGDYKYMCTECPARFLYKSNLNTHTFVHKKPHLKCDMCDRAFYTKLLLRRHNEAEHLGIKNHVCNICGKAFGYRNAMMKHQRCVHKREKLTYGRKPSYLQVEPMNTEIQS